MAEAQWFPTQDEKDGLCEWPVVHILEATCCAFQFPHSHNLSVNSQRLSSHSSWLNRVKYRQIHTGLVQGPTFEPS